MTMIAHLSDLHLTHPRELRFGEATPKRMLAWLSWRLRRRHEHCRHVLDALVEDVHRFAPEQVVITGDLTYLGLPQEFEEGRQWLEQLGVPSSVFVVPGNHDACAAAPFDATLARWWPYCGDSSDAAIDGGGRDTREAFPTLRILGDIALIGLSTARPTPPLLATGALGPRQLGRLEALLASVRSDGGLRILLLHHPPAEGVVGWRKRLSDRAALRELLARQGADLILHGHAHRPSVRTLAAGPHRIPVIGVPSASSRGHRPGRAAAYNLYRIERDAGDACLELTIRRIDSGGRGFETAGVERIRLGTAVAV